MEGYWDTEWIPGYWGGSDVWVDGYSYEVTDRQAWDETVIDVPAHDYYYVISPAYDEVVVDQQAWTETVTDSPAWTETVVDTWKTITVTDQPGRYVNQEVPGYWRTDNIPGWSETVVVVVGHWVTQPPRIVLLLHGMNSEPATWDAFVAAAFGGVSAVIDDGQIVGSIPAQTSAGIRCYRVQFGAADYFTGAIGLDGLTVPSSGYPYVRCGDFEDFTTLGGEVDAAIGKILNVHPNAQILLVGHSRGGLAGRAFLQGAGTSANRAAVVGLLTTGSPHRGSPLGKIYQWLGLHSRSDPLGTNDWSVADWLRSGTVVTPWWPKPPLDVRRPTIADLADNSSALSILNASSAVAALPNIAYGEIVYDSVPVGTLKIGYSVFDGIPTIVSPISDAGRVFILGNAQNTPMTFAGDGLVPFANQWIRTLPGFQGKHLSIGHRMLTRVPLQISTNSCCKPEL